MSVNEERLQYLLKRNTAKSCSKEEMQELYQYIAAIQDEQLEPVLDYQYNAIDAETKVEGVDWEYMLNNILKTVQLVPEKHKVRRLWWQRISVAAAILILIFGSIYFLMNKPESKLEIANNSSGLKDISAPISTKAKIILANGQQVSLDSINSGNLVQQGNVSVSKTADGNIIYNGTSTEMEYNTLANPKGSKTINITLSDGTKVWLNSESSLRYPVAFMGDERKVEIIGEGYFEVSKDPKRKFLVDAKGVITEVLGTHFNVNSYDNELSTKITLLEGSVKVSKGNSAGWLKPGQQASVDANIKVADAIDIDEVMAWKNEKFIFQNADLKSVMRQLERWYDVETEYKTGTNEEFIGVISRNVKISEILKMLEATGAVKFEIQGKKIIVK